jgi:F-type H+-transporting ATPase subunit delta
VADLGIRYASALFDISKESGLMNEFLEQAQLLRDNLQEEDALLVLTHPRISGDEKYAFITKAFGDSIHQDLLGFIQLVISKNREAYLVPALDKLVEMIKVYKNQATAKVISAEPLSDAQITQLAKLLSKKLEKQVDITVKVDPSVIAGITIQVDGFFLDRTVKSMLKDLKETVRKGAAANDS